MNVFRNAITVLNYQNQDRRPNPIKYTFALLGSYRNYNTFSGGLSVDPEETHPERSVYQRINNETTRSNDNIEPPVFELVKMKLGYKFIELMRANGEPSAKKMMENEEPFLSISKLIKKYLRLSLDISAPGAYSLNIFLALKDEEGRIVNPMQLSSGEKGILHFIFSVYGYDLKNGVMIIDEPELHLHPQMQKQYLRIIEEVKRKFDIQFIIATHSPQFVSKDTIPNVYRFYLDKDRNTKAVNPTITEEQKSLAQFLTYTNSSKIFFVNKVILVEGETDEYFYRYYLDWLRNNAD